MPEEPTSVWVEGGPTVRAACPRCGVELLGVIVSAIETTAPSDQPWKCPACHVALPDEFVERIRNARSAGVHANQILAPEKQEARRARFARRAAARELLTAARQITSQAERVLFENATSDPALIGVGPAADDQEIHEEISSAIRGLSGLIGRTADGEHPVFACKR